MSKKTIADYDREIADDPNAAEAYNSRGVLHLRADRFRQAIADFTRAIETNPDFAEAYYNRGTALMRRDADETDEAIADMKKANELGLED